MAEDLLGVRPASALSTLRIWLPLLVAAAAWIHHRRIRAARRRYHLLAPKDREIIVLAVIFAVHNGAIERGQIGRGQIRKPARVLADLLDREVHLVDEALRRLIAHGHLAGVCGGTLWHLATHIEITDFGRDFHTRHLYTPGVSHELAPWGALVHSPTGTGPGGAPRLVNLPREESRPPAP